MNSRLAGRTVLKALRWIAKCSYIDNIENTDLIAMDKWSFYIELYIRITQFELVINFEITKKQMLPH